MPAAKGIRGDGAPRERGDGSRREKERHRGVSPGRRAGSTQPTRTRAAVTQPQGLRDGAARDSGGRRDPRGRRSSPPPRGLARWGALQGGLGVCVIVASAAAGAIVTMVARSAPGPLLGLFVVAGAIVAALAVRPRAGRMILPVPALSYVVAALLSGVVYDRSADSSKAELAIGAAQWIADGFFSMALATVLAVAIISVRWYLWRRGRPATRDPGWPVPPAGPGRARSGSVRTDPNRTDPSRTGRDGPPRPSLATAPEPGYPTGLAGPVNPRQIAQENGLGGPGAPRGWGDRGSRGTGPRPAPRPGAEPYNFSSGA